jgi:hypothetical protein
MGGDGSGNKKKHALKIQGWAPDARKHLGRKRQKLLKYLGKT